MYIVRKILLSLTDKPKIRLANKTTSKVSYFRHEPTEAHLF